MPAKSTARASARARTAKRTAKTPRAKAAPPKPDMRDLAKMAKGMTPQQAFDLYKANAKMALDIIDTAIENTARLRKHQFAGEEEARSMQKKALRHAAEASNPQALMAAGQSVSQEALEKAMRYWSEMFDMIVEMQKRLFALLEDQMADVPGAKEAKAAMAMMPDFRQTQNLVRAMQGVMSSGGSAFESMQRVMGDFTRLAQQNVPGLNR